jgi:hypothetical protein
MAVISRDGRNGKPAPIRGCPVSRRHYLRYVITRCLAAEPVLYRRRRPLAQFSEDVPGCLAIVGRGCFSEPVEQRGQDLFLLARAIMPTAGRPPSSR